MNNGYLIECVKLNEIDRIKTSFIDNANDSECTEKLLRASETEVMFSVIPCLICHERYCYSKWQ